MGEKKSEVLQGTLDLMVLKTLYAMGSGDPVWRGGIAGVGRTGSELDSGTTGGRCGSDEGAAA